MVTMKLYKSISESMNEIISELYKDNKEKIENLKKMMKSFFEIIDYIEKDNSEIPFGDDNF